MHNFFILHLTHDHVKFYAVAFSDKAASHILVGDYYIHYGIPHICRVALAHGKDTYTHNNVFVVCCTRQIAHDKQASAKEVFVVSLLSCTRQSVCHTAKIKSLPCASGYPHSKD